MLALRFASATRHNVKQTNGQRLEFRHVIFLLIIAVMELGQYVPTVAQIIKFTWIFDKQLQSIYIKKEVRILMRFGWLKITSTTTPRNHNEAPVYGLTARSWVVIDRLFKHFDNHTQRLSIELLRNKRHKRYESSKKNKIYKRKSLNKWEQKLTDNPIEFPVFTTNNR
jgi:hypothetical protein